jgi:hydrogenase maturation protein HypF
MRAESRYEGQAAMELEGLAAACGPVAALPGGWNIRYGVLDFSPLVPALLECDDASYGAALFHATLAAGLAEWALVAVDGQKGAKIAVGGGCAMNAVLMSALRGHLDEAGATLLEARQAPPNDGGLALGQGWVARRMVGGT